MGQQTIPDPFRSFWTRVQHCEPMPINASPFRQIRTSAGVRFRVECFRFKVSGRGFRVLSIGHTVQGMGFSV
jgi:hypothetical protein